MDIGQYERTWIACGSYATINALQDESIDLLELENATGASFGIMCMQEQYGFTRMVTPFRDFHAGIDEALPLWGIGLKRFDLSESESVGEVIENPGYDRFVIGPLNMPGLSYLPFPAQYKYSDHYIAVLKSTDGNLRLMDSEGIPIVLTDPEEMARWMSEKEIPESYGKLTIRTLWKKGKTEDIKVRLSYTVRKAADHLNRAECSGQGAHALAEYLNMITGTPMSKWREPALYSMNYLQQRKLMTLELAHKLRPYVHGDILDALEDVLRQQYISIGYVYQAFQNRHMKAVPENICKIADRESMLTTIMKEIAGYDWN